MKDGKTKAKNKSYFNSDLFLTMEESHIEWAIYDATRLDYYVSINKETLKKIKEWNTLKWKFVCFSDHYNDIEAWVQKNLFITLLTDEERKGYRCETEFIETKEKVYLKISNYLLNNLIETNLEDYQHRYDVMWNKIHFLVADWKRPFNEESWFDDTFKYCEKLNKKLPTSWDLFESEYINAYKQK